MPSANEHGYLWQGIEFRAIADQSCGRENAFISEREQLKGIRRVIHTAEALRVRRHETEATVEGWVTKDEDGGYTTPPAFVQATLNERRADSAPLPFRKHRDGS